MGKHISDYKELYATFMRIKDNKPQLEYTVFVPRKDSVMKSGAKADR